MKKKIFTAAMALVLAGSMTFTSCIGSFALSNKVLAWNQQVGSKFVNELVFFAFWIVPVYEITTLADVLVLNSIEFWSGSNPVADKGEKAIDTESGRYLVKCDETGYTITSTQDGSVVKFAFHEEDNSWSLDQDGKSIKFMTFIDDSHVKMLTPDGDFQTVELSQAGGYAYRQMVTGNYFAMK